MADPLSQLRQFHVNKREIKETNGFIIFGENGWPKSVKTNYQICQSKTNKEYYTLECLLYFLKNKDLSHHFYVKKAAQDNVSVVHRPDRKDLLSYLTGETNTSSNIDRNAPIPASTSIQQEFGDNRSANIQRPNQDNYKRLLDKFAASLDEPKLKKPEIAPSTSARELAISELGPDKLAEIRNKRLAKKRSTIIDADSEIGLAGKSGSSQKDSSALKEAQLLIEYDQKLMEEIKHKEKIWRTRSSMLQAHSKNFAKSVLPLIQAIAKMDDASFKKTTTNNAVSPVEPPVVKPPPTTQTAQYSRYDQERFANPSDATLGFNIDTRQTYHGNLANQLSQPAVNGSNGLSSSHKPPGLPPGMNNYSNHPSNNRALTGQQQAAISNSANNKRRQSRVPIIIIPATTTTLISMHNAMAILQDLKFVESKSDTKRESELLIQRKKPDGTSSAYRVIDNPIKLDDEDWNRVVAVFVQGPAWQFKGWPWGGTPVEIFSRIKAFHLKFDETPLDANVAKWNVHVIELSRSKRHLDKANMLKFWSSLDSYMMKNKKNLKF